MRQRVYSAMHKVWTDRCSECRAPIEFGNATGIHPSEGRFIQVARIIAEPHLIVGIWHARPAEFEEWSIMNEQVFSPPVHKDTLPRFYRIVIANESSIMWIPEALEREALREK
jgi:hypothetical protein